MNRKLRSNQGLTLVEMLVSVALLALIMTGVFALMRSASKYYSDSAKEVEIQNEMQSAFTQISNMVIDADLGITYDESAKKMTACHSDGYYVVQMIDSSIYVSQTSFTTETDDQKKSIASMGTVVKTDENMLTNRAETFIVDTSNQQNGYVVLALRLTYQNRSAYMSQNVFLRNSATNTSIVDEGASPTSGGATSTITPTVTTSVEDTPTPTPIVPETTVTPAPTATPTPVWSETPGESTGKKMTIDLSTVWTDEHNGYSFTSVFTLIGNTIVSVKPISSKGTNEGVEMRIGDQYDVGISQYVKMNLNQENSCNFVLDRATLWFMLWWVPEVESVEITYK